MNQSISHTSQKGFTLIELSIVLVIIGLIVGGILVGRDLIRASEIRSVVSDINSFMSAANTYKLKYNCVPGDCIDATLTWGIASGGCPNGARSGTQSCDGDGNGQIDQSLERFWFWQHLGNANLIRGQFTGMDGPANNGYNAVIGVNVPASKFLGAGYDVSYWGTNPALSGFFPGVYNNIVQLGGQTVNNVAAYGILLTSDALSIDIKMDDGKPGTGMIVTYTNGTFGYNQGNCATTTIPSTALYDITFRGQACALMWRNLF